MALAAKWLAQQQVGTLERRHRLPAHLKMRWRPELADSRTSQRRKPCVSCLVYVAPSQARQQHSMRHLPPLMHAATRAPQQPQLSTATAQPTA
jgi:hypothetical protein